ncbi:MAG: hypothetical protein FWE10_07415 [Rikenellaceae bacterium]|nr:hypothetical protein [Rikenellaceae bacterium]
MKSKKTTYLLLGGVLVVWGLILWKMFFNKAEDVASVAPVHRVIAEPVAADKLVLNYRDPFLQETATIVRSSPRPAATSHVAAPPVEEPLTPYIEHRLRYLGQITRNGAVHGLVEIDGVLHTIRRGDTAEGYRLETIWRDSIRLRHDREMFTVRLGE